MTTRKLILAGGFVLALSGSLAAQTLQGNLGAAPIYRIPMKIVEAQIGESTLLPAQPVPAAAAKQSADTVAGAASGVRHFLAPNVPNPFRETTTISYSLARDERVTIRVYDAFYNQIKILVDEDQAAGLHSIPFDAAGLSSGFFFYALSTPSRSAPEWGRMVLMR